MCKKPLNIECINAALQHKNTLDMLRWCYGKFEHERIKLSTSFGAEGMVLLHMLAHQVKTPRVFTIDTGRMFQQTYDVWQKAIEKFGVEIEIFYPEQKDIDELTRGKGPNMFFKSTKNRKQCCYVRKVKPLKRALKNTDVWIAGLRREQASSRRDIELFSYVEEHKVYKLCPLAPWREENIWEYIRNNNVPYNVLYDEGYPTIGCAPCCRAVGRAQEMRAGRWWWEQDNEKKECGIHMADGRIKRNRDQLNFNI